MNVQEINANGGTLTFSTPSASDSFLNDGREVLVVNNGSGSAITVTISSYTPCNYGYTHDLEVTVTDGETSYIGTFQPGRFNDSSGLVNVTFSATTSVTAAVMKI
jgi:hypothetical protein